MSAATPVIAELEAAGLEVDASSRRLAEYSYDASNYRVPPVALVFPRTPGDVQRAVLVCRRHATPVVPRGGGTSMAGNAVGRGVVLDFSRHMTAIGELDTVSGTIGVEPGVVLGSLSAHVEEASGGTLTFAPDPSSKSRATVGGAIGNDACGNHSVRHGRTSDHLVEVDLVTSDGALLTAFKGGLRPVDPADAHSARRARELEDELRRLAGAAMAPLRTRLGRIPRQVSGYQLHHLLPEHGFDSHGRSRAPRAPARSWWARACASSGAPAATLLVCLGYRTSSRRPRRAPILLEYWPAAVEGIDEAIVATVRWRRRGRTPCRGCPAAGPGSMSNWTVTIPPRSRPAPESCWAAAPPRDGWWQAGPDPAARRRCGGCVRTARAFARGRGALVGRRVVAGLGGLRGRPGTPRRIPGGPAAAAGRHG